MRELSPRDVSVVAQGPVNEWTEHVLRSAHRFLPGSQVILSTWEGTCPPELAELALVVESVDPGGGPQPPGGAAGHQPLMNTNRMATSTLEGVSRAARPFTFKLRSDTPLISDAVLGWSAASSIAPQSLFSERLLTCSVATRPASTQVLYHLSDCIHFGPTSDVADLWGSALTDEEENVGYWRRQGRTSPWMWDSRYANEQLLWLNYLRRAGVPFDYPHLGHPVTDEEGERSTRLFTENFVVLEPWQLGIRFCKLDPVIRASGLASYMFFEDWLTAGGALQKT